MLQNVFIIITVHIIITVFSVFPSVHAKEDNIILRYGNKSQDLRGYAHYLETNTILRTISHQQARKGLNSQKTSFRRLNIEQNMHVTSEGLSSSAIAYNVLARVIRKETDQGFADKLNNYRLKYRCNDIGQWQKTFHILDLLQASLPVIFPNDAVHLNDKWTKQVFIQIDDLPHLLTTMDYQLNKIRPLNGKEVAEIAYTVGAEIKTTEVTEDIGVLEKINLLRTRGIEKITVSGHGQMTFSLNDQQPVAHILNIIVEISERIVTKEQRELRESIREINRAEVLRPL